MDSMMLFYIIMIVSLGAYFQTVTGFGLGIIVVGLTVSFDFASIAFIARKKLFIVSERTFH